MLLIKNGRVIDPKTKTNAILDILIDEDKIIKIDEHIEEENADVLDATNLIVAPGLIDNHVHFRDPGFTHKETLKTGANAAKAGGFTTVVCMGNTKPCVDNVEVLQDIQKRAESLPIHVLQTANVTLGMKGKELTNMVSLKEAGTIGFTDDGVPISDPKV
uniref:amidohydrolase family protein n=1 Tax=uncultured Sharpea sp. TaxID=1112738 RepID=UPI0025897112